MLGPARPDRRITVLGRRPRTAERRTTAGAAAQASPISASCSVSTSGARPSTSASALPRATRAPQRRARRAAHPRPPAVRSRAAPAAGPGAGPHLAVDGPFPCGTATATARAPGSSSSGSQRRAAARSSGRPHASSAAASRASIASGGPAPEKCPSAACPPRARGRGARGVAHRAGATVGSIGRGTRRGARGRVSAPSVAMSREGG
jgi:hypothetical protein